jgi:hypothetical protein
MIDLTGGEREWYDLFRSALTHIERLLNRDLKDIIRKAEKKRR